MIRRYFAQARHLRFWKQFGQRVFAAVGLMAVSLGLWALFYPDLFKKKWWVVAVVAVVALTWALVVERPRLPQKRYSSNATIRLVVGDLFDQTDGSLLIGMTSTFDTSVTGGIIAPNSVQAHFLNRIYAGSEVRLDMALDSALSGIAPAANSPINKPGKQVVYPIGTVATLSATNAQKYFCVAYTDMDVHNVAQGSIRGVLDSLDAVWDACDRHSNGAPVCVPLIGQGQSRISELTGEVSARLIAFSFVLRTRRHRFSRELRIVVTQTTADNINMAEFQAFLTSLEQ
ncbi:hypothetical protein BOX37_07785 [Nocardia mangyaensis]|uniref:Thoeris protein ThsA Macro domain-containing protein n=1 Tax=Nocardia mangyaensis TaxID=2213200 RepID=A0A1J0VPE0_9NOCA|nr:macro domain-containing protein [Nocardia mangyaensis]APE33886.1 hypothetical protein BOX37_07785 [Nocardia mangyaensis]